MSTRESNAFIPCTFYTPNNKYICIHSRTSDSEHPDNFVSSTLFVLFIKGQKLVYFQDLFQGAIAILKSQRNTANKKLDSTQSNLNFYSGISPVPKYLISTNIHTRGESITNFRLHF